MAILVMWVLPLAMLVGCAGVDDEQAILTLLADMEQALENRELDGFMAPVADDVEVQNIGGRRELRARLAFFLLRHKQIGIHVISKTVTLDKDLSRGTLRFGAVVAGADGAIPERADMLDIDAELAKRDGGWQVVKVRWERGVYIGE